MNRSSMRYCLAAAAFAVSMTIGSEVAMAEDMDSHPSFIGHFDQDGDGLVSVDEFPGVEHQFDHLDADGDGYIDESEAPQGPPPRRPGAG